MPGDTGTKAAVCLVLLKGVPGQRVLTDACGALLARRRGSCWAADAPPPPGGHALLFYKINL